MTQCSMTCWLEKVFDFNQRLALVGLQANTVAKLFPVRVCFYPNVILNLFLQLINACLNNWVFNLRVLPHKHTSLLNQRHCFFRNGVTLKALAFRFRNGLTDYRAECSYDKVSISMSLVDLSPEKSMEPSAASSVDSL